MNIKQQNLDKLYIIGFTDNIKLNDSHYKILFQKIKIKNNFIR